MARDYGRNPFSACTMVFSSLHCTCWRTIPAESRTCLPSHLRHSSKYFPPHIRYSYSLCYWLTSGHCDRYCYWFPASSLDNSSTVTPSNCPSSSCHTTSSSGSILSSLVWVLRRWQVSSYHLRYWSESSHYHISDPRKPARKVSRPIQKFFPQSSRADIIVQLALRSPRNIADHSLWSCSSYRTRSGFGISWITNRIGVSHPDSPSHLFTPRYLPCKYPAWDYIGSNRLVDYQTVEQITILAKARLINIL